MGKKQGNKKRVVYIIKGRFQYSCPLGAPPSGETLIIHGISTFNLRL
jgi:hypothetical protein